jgi:hypothetical protein
VRVVTDADEDGEGSSDGGDTSDVREDVHATSSTASCACTPDRRADPLLVVVLAPLLGLRWRSRGRR